MARRGGSKSAKREQALTQAIISVAAAISLAAYFVPAFRAKLFSGLIWLTVIVAVAGAFLWWRKARTAKQTQSAPDASAGAFEVDATPVAARLPSKLDQVWTESAVPARGAAAPETPSQLSVELLNQIEWKRFEELCAAYFRTIGFDAATQAHGADGGIDIRLTAKGKPDEVVNIVQCKAWKKPVGIKPMRELLGVMASTKSPRGTFVSRGGFHGDAEAFARANKIFPMGGAELIAGIAKRPAAEQAHLLAVAIEGEYWKPTCASCGIKLVERSNKKTGISFLGCTNYPRCKTKMLF